MARGVLPQFLARAALAAVLSSLAPAWSDAASVTLLWDPNSESDLAGYVVSYGTQPGVYATSVDVGNQTSWSSDELAGGQHYYFAVQAYNTGGLFSAYSNEVDVVTELPPPAPVVTAVTPASGPANGGTAITVTGENFAAGAIVLVGSKPALGVVVVSATAITATTPSALAGAVDVRVTNLDGQSSVLAGAFTYVSTALTVTGITPTTGLITGGTAVTITGTNFGTGANVFIGGIAATSIRVVNSTTLTALTGAHSAGLVDVRVTMPDGRSGALPAAFTYVGGRPQPTNVSPNRGSKLGGTSVTVSGANFATGATVTFGGVAATNVQVVNATTLTATTPPDPTGDPADPSPHTVDVRVQNTDGQNGTLTGGYVYDVVSPGITSLSPTSGATTGNTRVTLRGVNFAQGAVVFFDGQAATGVVFVGDATLTALTPAHAAGVVDVSVRNPDGTQGLRTGAFTYVGDDPTTDTDRDGLPDVWENQWGLDPNNATGLEGAAGDPDHDGRTNLKEYADKTHPRGFVTRYFAEGINGSFFTTVFALANAGDDTARVAMLFMLPTGTISSHAVTIAPRSRLTVDARTLPAVAASAFSTKIESDVFVVADRTLSWDAQGYGAHAETAIESPATVWYLAEGATHSGFDLFYLIQNPNAQAAQVQVRYLLPSGTPLTKNYTVKANSRFNIWVDLEHTLLARTDVSAVVTSTNGVPIIVERSMYLNAGGRPFGAGHNSAGVTSPATRWFLAEGATGRFFDEFILVANPGSQAAAVKASFLLPSGETVEKFYTVAANSRFNIWVDLEDPRLEATAVSATVESTNDVPIIVERAMWWPGPRPSQWAEAHSSPGITRTATRWALAEGEERGPQSRSTYILIANTSAESGSARVTLLFEDGTTSAREFPLLPNSRFNVAVGTEFPEAANRRFGTLIESLGEAPAELVVERAMYWNAVGQHWAAGTNAVATPLP